MLYKKKMLSTTEKMLFATEKLLLATEKMLLATKKILYILLSKCKNHIKNVVCNRKNVVSTEKMLFATEKMRKIHTIKFKCFFVFTCLFLFALVYFPPQEHSNFSHR